VKRIYRQKTSGIKPEVKNQRFFYFLGVIVMNDDAKISGTKAVPERRRPEVTERIAYSVEEFAAATGLAKNTVRAAIRHGEIKTKKCGRRILIPAWVVDEFKERDNSDKPGRGREGGNS
jgi:excisionase family DNA binding protein